MVQGMLQGWKAIAGFLDRDERTVRRWEKQFGMPVRRLTHDRKSVVYAIPAELEEWLLQPRSGLRDPLQTLDAAVAAPGDPPQASDHESANAIHLVPANAKMPEPVARQQSLLSGNRSLIVATLLLGITFVGATSLAYRTTRSAHAAVNQPEASPSTADPDESIAEGELLLDRRTPDSVNRAVEILTRRAEQSPPSAHAYASLAKALCLVREYSSMPSSKAFPLAENAANQALALEPNNADAHAALGFIDFFWKWDAQAAEGHFDQAITLSPTSALAHQWYGSMLVHQGRHREALRQLNQAQALAPSSTAIISTRAMALSLSGQRAAANEILKRLESDAPEALAPHRTMAYLSMQEPIDVPAFLNETETFDRLRRDGAGVAEIAQARQIYNADGKASMLRFLLADERKRCRNNPHPSFRVAQFEALLGEDDAAMSHAAVAVQNHDETAIALSIDPAFEHLRASGRLDTLLQGVPSSRNGTKPGH